jgi:hypothetical protein
MAVFVHISIKTAEMKQLFKGDSGVFPYQGFMKLLRQIYSIGYTISKKYHIQERSNK